MKTHCLAYPLAADAAVAQPIAQARPDCARTPLGADEARMLLELSLRAATAAAAALPLTFIW